MAKSSTQKMTENQAVFRTYNERIQKSLDEAKHTAAEEGEQPIEMDDDIQLHFYCECSDENCRQRIQLSPQEYNDIHTSRDRFIVVPGHEITKIEEVVSKTTDYTIVEKYLTPPESPTQLNPSLADNS